jgi:phosphopantetheinyl transferase (holo-ACP synthase)
MATQSSLSTFKTDADLIACGIDAELIERFAEWGVDAASPSPLIYSRREIEHSFTLTSPLTALCASFCCKEAVFKAIQHPYDFCQCELLWHPNQEQFDITLADTLLKQFKITQAIASVTISPVRECVVIVYLLQ